jgi:hypothetical protein
VKSKVFRIGLLLGLALSILLGPRQPPVRAQAQSGCVITPPNVIPGPGDAINFNISLTEPPNGEYLFSWGQGNNELGRNACRTPANSNYTETIAAGTVAQNGTYWAKVSKGCLAPVLLCGPTSFQVGNTSGSSPMTPPDQRSTFICKGKPECEQCILAGNWWTVLGCLPIGQGGVAQVLINFITGIAGGIAFLMMLKGAFLLMTSQGDFNRVKAGKSSMTKGAAGLLIVVFATVILRIMAADILKLPGFGG